MNMPLSLARNRFLTAALTSLVALTALSACTPLLMGGAAVTGALVASDRRTSGAQLEDQAIEIKAANRIKDEVGSRARALVTSYNRRVLLTGEVASAADRPASHTLLRDHCTKEVQGNSSQPPMSGRSMNSTGNTKPNSTGNTHSSQAKPAAAPRKRTGWASWLPARWPSWNTWWATYMGRATPASSPPTLTCPQG